MSASHAVIKNCQPNLQGAHPHHRPPGFRVPSVHSRSCSIRACLVESSRPALAATRPMAAGPCGIGVGAGIGASARRVCS
jgi:hypothetical protein